MNWASPPHLLSEDPQVGHSLVEEDVGKHLLVALPEEEERPTGSLYDMLEDAYSKDKLIFRKTLLSKPKLFVFQFLYCIKLALWLLFLFPFPCFIVI